MFKRSQWGIHPDYQKTHTASKPIELKALPDTVVIPVRQHIGAPCEVLVAKGDLVKKGQLIASSPAAMSSNIHASLSGKVTDIALYPHPVFGQCQAIVIENDGQDEWVDGVFQKRDWTQLSVQEILDIVKQNGVVGMGGATFPAHIKLAPPADRKIDTLVINAAECEPFLTVDHRIMLEYTPRVAEGIRIIQKILSVENVVVGIEDNKMDAVKAMGEAFKGTAVKVVAVPTRYPQGAEKMLINTLLGREVPSGKLPMDVGVVVQNVSTAVAIYDAIVNNIPLIERVVTISGGATFSPSNLLLRIGTTFEDAVNLCDGLKEPPEKMIMGGPMMGIAQYTKKVPVIKGTSGILMLSEKDVCPGKEQPCIRCGRCVDACPMGLNPSMLSILGERNLIEESKEEYHLLDCIECGCCSFSCPAKRNIVHYIKYTKKQYADLAAKKGAKK